MIRKSIPSGFDPIGANRFPEKIMLHQRARAPIDSIRNDYAPVFLPLAPRPKAGAAASRADRDLIFLEDPSRTRHRPDRNHRETCPN